MIPQPIRTLHSLPRLHRAFALMDVLLCVALMGVLALVVVPSLQPGESLKLISASVMITADVEYAQSASLISPADPVTFRVDDKLRMYWLALASTPEIPIERPGGGPYQVVFGQQRAEYLNDINIRLEHGQDGAIVFDQFGRLPPGPDAEIILSGVTGQLVVRVSSSTGSVSIVQPGS